MSGRYILGSGRAPDWLKERLMIYQRADGGIGYEIRGRVRTFQAVKGDTVELKDNGYLRVTSSTTPQAARSPFPASGDGKEGLDESKEGGYLE